MNVLDENVLESQRQLLRSWRIPVRQTGMEFSFHSIPATATPAVPNNRYANPYGGLIELGGRLYGTASGAGSLNPGSVFSVNPDDGSIETVHGFQGLDGSNPFSALTANGGMLYGTTANGGEKPDGTWAGGILFRLDPSTGEHTILHTFLSDAVQPWAGVVEVGGSLYGVTVFNSLFGGPGGTLYRYDQAAGEFTVLHTFTGADGSNPYAGVVESGEKLYGAAIGGGSEGVGTLYNFDLATGEFAVLHEFSTAEGAYPTDARLLVWNGKLYGATWEGGANNDGVLFSFDPGDDTYTVLHHFSSAADRYVGATPIEVNGQLYGTTYEGGDFGAGTFYRFNPATGTLTVIHHFNGTDGTNPSGLSSWIGSAIYGSTYAGGADDLGTVFRIDLMNDAPVAAGQTVTTAEGTSVDIALGASDVDGDALTYAVASAPVHGTLTGTAPDLTYTSAANYNGPDSFTFAVNDGTATSAQATVSITVTPVNDLPTAVGQVLETYDNAPLAITLTGSDVETNPLTYRIVSAPTAGSHSGTPPNVVYTPPFPYAGPDSFTFEVEDADGAKAQATVALTILASDRPPVARAGADQSVIAGTDCLATVAVDGGGSSDADGDVLSFTWKLFLNGEVIDTATGLAAVSWSLPAGSYEAVLTVSTDKAGTIVSRSDSLVIQVSSGAPVLAVITPAAAYANGPAFSLTVTGGCFLPGAVVHWNGQPRTTTVVNGGELTAAIPASDLQTGVAIAVATVQVVNGDGQVSNPLGFSIVVQTVGTADAAVTEPGGTSTVSTAPTSAGAPGVTVTVQNSSAQSVTVLAATYDTRPVGETAFQVDNGSFVDVQVAGADANVVATAFFYYPSTTAGGIVGGGMENRVKLRYFDGANWIAVLSSGGLPPAEDTTDNLDGTVSGGRFTVVFDMTSTPKITDLNGTVFGMFESEPQLGAITGPTGPMPLGTAVGVTANFAVVGDPANAAVRFLWDDGTESTVAPTTATSATAAHLYAAPGVYGVTVQVTDGQGDVGESTSKEYNCFSTSQAPKLAATD